MRWIYRKNELTVGPSVKKPCQGINRDIYSREAQVSTTTCCASKNISGGLLIANNCRHTCSHLTNSSFITQLLYTEIYSKHYNSYQFSRFCRFIVINLIAVEITVCQFLDQADVIIMRQRWKENANELRF